MHTKFLLILIIVLCLSVYNNAFAGDYLVNNPPFKKVTVRGDETLNGIFDPSVEYSDDGIGWMAYSRVSLPKYVSTRLAKSSDKGRTWVYVSTVNSSYDEIIEAKGKIFNGVWRNETPSLVYDSGDVPKKRWKLFSQKYYTTSPFKKGGRLFEKGWIEYKTASTPNGPWSKAQCLFGKVEGKCRFNPNMLDATLSKNSFYNEIGTIYHQGVIYLSVDASANASGLGKWNKRSVVLFSSSDHGKSWRFAGKLTDYDDAKDFGYLVFTGTSLVKENNRLFLLATPSGKKGLFVKNRGHDGTYVVEFDDISKAKLKRDSSGKLQVIKKFIPEFNSGGLSDYDEKNIYGGVVFSQINIKDLPEAFQVYNTKKKIQK